MPARELRDWMMYFNWNERYKKTIQPEDVTPTEAKAVAKEIDAGMIEAQQQLKAMFPKVNHA
jgi:hypothetical protein